MDALERGDDSTARQHFESALTDPADKSRALSQLEDMEMARAQELERDQPREAIAIYQTLLGRNVDAHRVRMRLGKMLVVDGQVDLAVKILQENPRCTACGQQLGSMLANRGRERLRASQWDLARADLEVAAAVLPTAGVYLDLAQLFTLGGNGSSEAASQAMVSAYPLLGGDAKLQERWAAIREDVVRACIRGGDFTGADRALEPEDPRVQMSDEERAKSRLMLRIDVADALKHAGKIDLAIKRVGPIWETAETLGLSQDPGLRSRILDLYAKGVAAALAANDETSAAGYLQAGMAIDPQHTTLRLQAAVMVVGRDAARAQEALDAITDKGALWNKAQALIYVQQAFEALDAGEARKASALLERAEDRYADALELRLAQAQLYSLSPVPNIGRRDVQRLQREGKVSYSGKPVQLARASAELAWVEKRWARPSAKNEALRLPGFASRLEALRAQLAGKYPFVAKRIDDEGPQLLINNQSGKIATVDVVGAGVDEAVELDPDAEYIYEFEEPGAIKVVLPTGEFYLAVEGNTQIELKL